MRSLQDISQPYIKYTENTSLIHNNDDDDNGIIIVVIVNDNDNSNFENKEKVQL